MTELTGGASYQAQQATRALVADLGRVEHGKALGLNEKGELIGEGLKASFRGKVVDLLVRAGIAKQGSLGGRLAAGLVGKENFDLMLQARKDPGSLEASTVRNAISVFEGIQMRAAGSDFVQQNAVTDAIWSSMSNSTPLRELTLPGTALGGKLHETHYALHNEVFPKREALRQAVIDQVASDQPTALMLKAHPDELRAAYRLIAKRGVAQGSKALAGEELVQIKQMMTADGRAGRAVARATDIALEFNRAASLIRRQATAAEDPAARVDEFRGLYLDAIHNEFNRRDVEDGQRVRMDGQPSTPIKEGGAGTGFTSPEGELGGKAGLQQVRFGGALGEEMRSFAVRQPGGFPVETMERPAFPGVDPTRLGDIALRAEDTLAEISDLYEDAYYANNFSQIDRFAKDLTAIIQSRSIDGDSAVKGQAGELALKLLGKLAVPRSAADASANARASICGSLPAMLQLLDGLKSQARRDPDLKAQLLAQDSNIRRTAETELARTKDMLANPEKHADYFNAYEEAFAMDVYEELADDPDKFRLETRPVQSDGSAKAEAMQELAVVQSQASKVLEKLNAM